MSIKFRKFISVCLVFVCSFMFMVPAYATNASPIDTNQCIVENIQYETTTTDNGTLETGSYTENGVNLRYEIFTDVNGVKTGTVYQVDSLKQRSGGDVFQTFSINPQNGEFVVDGEVRSTEALDEMAANIASEVYVIDGEEEVNLQVQPRELYIYEREGVKQLASSTSDLQDTVAIAIAAYLASAAAAAVAAALGAAPVAIKLVEFSAGLFVAIAAFYISADLITAYFLTRSYLYVNSPNTPGRVFLNEYVYYYKDSGRTRLLPISENPIYTEKELPVY